MYDGQKPRHIGCIVNDPKKQSLVNIIKGKLKEKITLLEELSSLVQRKGYS